MSPSRSWPEAGDTLNIAEWLLTAALFVLAGTAVSLAAHRCVGARDRHLREALLFASTVGGFVVFVVGDIHAPLSGISNLVVPASWALVIYADHKAGRSRPVRSRDAARSPNGVFRIATPVRDAHTNSASDLVPMRLEYGGRSVTLSAHARELLGADDRIVYVTRGNASFNNRSELRPPIGGQIVLTDRRVLIVPTGRLGRRSSDAIEVRYADLDNASYESRATGAKVQLTSAGVTLSISRIPAVQGERVVREVQQRLAPC